MQPYNNNLKELARGLRNSMTKEEQCLWERLRHKALGLTFFRQRPIGDYIVDFYCPKAGLVIEVDGERHFNKEGVANDRARDAYMRSLGLSTMRIPGSSVMKNTDEVVETILRYIKSTQFQVRELKEE